MQVALEAAGSGTSYGSLYIPKILLDADTSCFVDLQQFIFEQAARTDKPTCLNKFVKNLACASQLRIFAGHAGPELTDINITPDFCKWWNWLEKLKQHNSGVVLAVAAYDMLQACEFSTRWSLPLLDIRLVHKLGNNKQHKLNKR